MAGALPQNVSALGRSLGSFAHQSFPYLLHLILGHEKSKICGHVGVAVHGRGCHRLLHHGTVVHKFFLYGVELFLCAVVGQFYAAYYAIGLAAADCLGFVVLKL